MDGLLFGEADLQSVWDGSGDLYQFQDCEYRQVGILSSWLLVNPGLYSCRRSLSISSTSYLQQLLHIADYPWTFLSLYLSLHFHHHYHHHCHRCSHHPPQERLQPKPNKHPSTVTTEILGGNLSHSLLHMAARVQISCIHFWAFSVLSVQCLAI